MKQSKNNSKFLLNLVTILTNQKMHDRSMMCDMLLSCIGKATLMKVISLLDLYIILHVWAVKTNAGVSY